MSLMFAALKKLENPASNARSTAAGLASASDAGSGQGATLLQRWSPAVLAVGVVLLGGWWLYPSGPVAPASDGEAATGTSAFVSAAARAGTVPADAATALPAVEPPVVSPMAATSAPAPAAAPTTVSTSAPTLQAAAQAAPQPATPTPRPAPRPMVRSAPEPMTDSAISVRDASEATQAADGQEVARAVAALGTAIHNDDFAAGREQLAVLTRLLPPQSLTLLRMQAWLAHESGETAEALVLYRRIVARMPGDQTAVINLAILEAGNGEGDSARQRLHRLRTRDADSREIERAISLVEAQLR